jgi:hypothetical protein
MSTKNQQILKPLIFLAVVAFSAFLIIFSAPSFPRSNSDSASNAELIEVVKMSNCHADKIANELAHGYVINLFMLYNVQNYCAGINKTTADLKRQRDAIKNAGIVLPEIDKTISISRIRSEIGESFSASSGNIATE